MTTVNELKKLVSKGESDQVEFKKKANHPEKIIREAIAFANAHGGCLLIGIDDDKNIIGLKDPIEEKEALDKCIRELVRPGIKYETELIPISQKRKVLLYRIGESSRKPHYLNNGNNRNRGTAYFRYHDKSIKASRELLEVIRMRKKHKAGFFLTYGNTEEQMIKIIDGNGATTIKAIETATGMGRKKISRALIRLVLANIVELEPREGHDLYLIKEPAMNFTS